MLNEETPLDPRIVSLKRELDSFMSQLTHSEPKEVLLYAMTLSTTLSRAVLARVPPSIRQAFFGILLGPYCTDCFKPETELARVELGMTEPLCSCHNPLDSAHEQTLHGGKVQ